MVSPVSVPNGPSWSELAWPARTYRAAHAGWATLQLTALGWVWWSAIRRRRGRGTVLAAAFLALQGGGLVAGRGSCPMTAVQHRLGDPIPMFGLVLPPRAARLAVPALAAVAVAGIAAAVLRPPRA